jgi:hypothetical protein
MMKRIFRLCTFCALVGAALIAQTKPPGRAPRDASALADYWHAIAAHHSQMAAYQASLTSQQKQILESIAGIDRELSGYRQKLCGSNEDVDEKGPNPVCVPKPALKKAK